MAIKIFIDQGHNPGGINGGAEGFGLREQDITYNVGIYLRDILNRDPRFEARVSRETPDTILGTSNATSLATSVNAANSWPADIFISLHNNAAENTDASGNEALVYGPGQVVANALAENILEQLTLTTGLRNRGIIYRPGLYVLKETEMPAVLVEMGFITNSYDAELLVNSPYLFATGIYRGILKYYGLL